MDPDERQQLQDLSRRLSRTERRSTLVRLADPIEAGSDPITVYEFRSCDESSLPASCPQSSSERRLYSDNPEIESHNPGEIAAIRRDGVIECWRLIGEATKCATGECVDILQWFEDCESCAPPCFNLFECDNPTNNFQVRGYDWIPLVDKIVLLDRGGLTCFLVSPPVECGSPDGTTVDEILECYDDCTLCGCYELTNCADASVIYVADNLAQLLGLSTTGAVVGLVLRIKGVCWEVTDFQTPCLEVPVLMEWTASDIEIVADCTACCYMLVPCDPEGTTLGPYRPSPSDPDLSEFVDDQGESNGKVLRLGNELCYTVETSADCVDATIGIGTVIDQYDSCACCKVYCLQECGSSTYLKTLSDLCQYETGDVLKRAEDGVCYELLDSLGPCDALSHADFTVEEEYLLAEHGDDACDHCTDPRFKLTPSCDNCAEDCGGTPPSPPSESDAIVTDVIDFKEFVGLYVKVEGKCYLVEWTTDEVTHPDLCWTGPFETCGECALAPTKLEFITRIYWEGDTLKAEKKTISGPFNVCDETTDDILTKGPCPTPE